MLGSLEDLHVWSSSFFLGRDWATAELREARRQWIGKKKGFWRVGSEAPKTDWFTVPLKVMVPGFCCDGVVVLECDSSQWHENIGLFWARQDGFLYHVGPSSNFKCLSFNGGCLQGQGFYKLFFWKTACVYAIKHTSQHCCGPGRSGGTRQVATHVKGGSWEASLSKASQHLQLAG